MNTNAIRSLRILVVVVAAIWIAYSDQRPVANDNSPLLRAVRSAKAKGETEVRIPPSLITPTGVDTINELIRDYTIARFQVIDHVTTATADGVLTWYKLRITETYSRQPSIPAGELPEAVPPQLLPLGESEALIAATGGTVTIDGVKVIQIPEEPGVILQDHKEYLGGLYLEFSGQLATPAAGASSLFLITDNHVSPQGDESRPLVQEFHNFYNDRLDAFLADVRRRFGDVK